MTTIEHRFVEEIPDALDEGILYISIPYSTVVHLCLCGCGAETVTPLAPTEWRMIYDGETISLAPSLGNWSSGCQSHYWISKNTVRWSTTWTRSRIEAGRRADADEKAEYYGFNVPRPRQDPAQHIPANLRRACRSLTKWWGRRVSE